MVNFGPPTTFPHCDIETVDIFEAVIYEIISLCFVKYVLTSPRPLLRRFLVTNSNRIDSPILPELADCNFQKWISFSFTDVFATTRFIDVTVGSTTMSFVTNNINYIRLFFRFIVLTVYIWFKLPPFLGGITKTTELDSYYLLKYEEHLFCRIYIWIFYWKRLLCWCVVCIQFQFF